MTPDMSHEKGRSWRNMKNRIEIGLKRNYTILVVLRTLHRHGVIRVLVPNIIYYASIGDGLTRAYVKPRTAASISGSPLLRTFCRL